MNNVVFQVNDYQSRRFCHVCGHLVGFHRLRNVFAASLRRKDCQGPLQYRLGHLVEFLTLPNASAMFSEDIDWQGLDFRVWRLLVGFRHCAMPNKVFFAIALRKGAGPATCETKHVQIYRKHRTLRRLGQAVPLSRTVDRPSFQQYAPSRDYKGPCRRRYVRAVYHRF